MLTIGVDYGLDSFGELPMYTVVCRENGQLHVVDYGLLDDFNYYQYVGSEHQIVGNAGDLERFKEQFRNN
jgi:hypothetical protein